MKWYEWVIAGMPALFIVLVSLPLILFIEWIGLMNDILEEKKRFSASKGEE